MKDQKQEHQDHSAEVDARRDAALRRALTTPPKPHKPIKAENPKKAKTEK